jgi:hypothetical protein
LLQWNAKERHSGFLRLDHLISLDLSNLISDLRRVKRLLELQAQGVAAGIGSPCDALRLRVKAKILAVFSGVLFLRGQPSVPKIIKPVKPSFVLLSANFASVPCVHKNHKSNNSQNPGGTK